MLVLPNSNLRSKHFHGFEKQRKIAERDFRCFAHTKMGQELKKKRKEGRGRKEMLEDRPLNFKKPCSPENSACDWLS